MFLIVCITTVFILFLSDFASDAFTSGIKVRQINTTLETQNSVDKNWDQNDNWNKMFDLVY